MIIDIIEQYINIDNNKNYIDSIYRNNTEIIIIIINNTTTYFIKE